MTTDALGDEWYHKPFRTHASRPIPRRYQHFPLPSFLHGEDGIWMKRYKWRTAKRRNERPGPAHFPRFRLYRAIAKAAAAAARRPKTCEPSEHEWDNDGCNPERCLKCGMSFTRYIFTECP